MSLFKKSRNLVESQISFEQETGTLVFKNVFNENFFDNREKSDEFFAKSKDKELRTIEVDLGLFINFKHGFTTINRLYFLILESQYEEIKKYIRVDEEKQKPSPDEDSKSQVNWINPEIKSFRIIFEMNQLFNEQVVTTSSTVKNIQNLPDQITIYLSDHHN